MALNRALQKPEESVRRPQTVDDTKLLAESNNDSREILAEITPETIAQTIDALASEIRQILYGLRDGRWSDVPAISLYDIRQIVGESGELYTALWIAGENISRGQPVYPALGVDNTVMISKATEIEHTTVIGIAYESALAGQQIRVALPGKEMAGFSNLSPGQRYFVQPAGGIGLTLPNTPGTFKLRVGFAKNPTTLLIAIGEPKVKP